MYDVSASKANDVRIFEWQAFKVLLLSVFGVGLFEMLYGWEWQSSLTATLAYELRIFGLLLLFKAVPALVYHRLAVAALGKLLTQSPPRQALVFYMVASIGLFALVALGWYLLVTGLFGMRPRATFFLLKYLPLLLLFLATLWLGARALQQRQPAP